MEASFGTDFSDVRVHTGSSAAESARAVAAHAYTVGNEVVLGDGQAPGSPAYERTLAHELTHVVQQRSGPVDGTPAGGGISLSDPADRFETAAEATADAVVSAGQAPSAGTTGVGASIQRQEELEDEEDVQAIAIQRERQDEELDEVAGTATPAEAAQAGATEGTALEQSPVRESTQDAGAGATAESAQSGAPEGGGLEEEEEVQELAIQRIPRAEDTGSALIQ